MLLTWWKKFRCFMGWHKIVDAHHSPNDPLKFLVYAKCKWCGFEGQIDSQGNLF